jgi:hypothetical protein
MMKFSMHWSEEDAGAASYARGQDTGRLAHQGAHMASAVVIDGSGPGFFLTRVIIT